MPHVKIVFLMRDPIGRAWSHAKHCYRYRETNFAETDAEFDQITEREWIDNFHQDWTLASGDYLGQLRRWLSVFPREQIYIGCFESIATEPERLLRQVLAFLGADTEFDLRDFPIQERSHPGLEGRLSANLYQRLHQILHHRSTELVSFLREVGQSEPPAEWIGTLVPLEESCSAARPAPFEREFDDRYLAGVLEQEESFPSAWAPVLGNHRNFNLVWDRNSVYALDVNLGNVQPAQIGNAQLRRYIDERRCFIAPTPAQVKRLIDEFIFERCEARLADFPALQSTVTHNRERLARVEALLSAQADVMERLESTHRLLRPWTYIADTILRPAWRWVQRKLRNLRDAQSARASAERRPL